MLARRKSKPSGIRDGGPIRNASHLKWVRGHVCAVPGCDTRKRIEAAHVDAHLSPDGRNDIPLQDRGGVSMKNGDNWTVPLCADHHAECHRVGAKSFAATRGINLHKIASELWANSPHRIKSERMEP